MLLSERGESILTGPVYEQLAPFLDGFRTADELVDLLAPHAEPAEVYYALLRLEAKGYIHEHTPEVTAQHPGHPHSVAVGEAAAPPARGVLRVAVSIYGLPERTMRSALADAGFEDAADGGVPLALVDDYLRPELDAVNRRALRDRRPWLLVKPVGVVPWVGPLFIPGQTCCWMCLAQRLRRNHAIPSFLRARGLIPDAVAIPSPAQGGTIAVALEAAAIELTSWLGSGTATPAMGAVLTRSPQASSTTRHALARRPQCPACGDETRYGRKISEKLVLRTRDRGGEASPLIDSPTHGLEAMGNLISPLTGVVHDLRSYPVTGCGPLHIWIAPGGSSFGRQRLEDVRRDVLHQPSGKGATSGEARAAAFGEAVERYCGVYQGDEPSRRATCTELGSEALGPPELVLFSESQFQRRAAWNAAGVASSRVAEPFDPSERIHWTPVWSITGSIHRWAPTSYLYYGHPEAAAPGFCWADSNGCAAGPSLAAAVLGGLLELVERDAAAIWWYNRIGRPGVPLKRVKDEFVSGVRNAFRENGRDTWALDLTHDLGIPTFVAVSRRLDRHPEEIVLGFGAHPDARMALRRAIAEMGQMLAATATLGADDGIVEPDVREWLSTATVAQHEFLLPKGESVGLDDYRSGIGTAPEALLDDCLAAIDGRGLEVLVLDQTRPDIELPVVKVIVPGLRHFWPRFAPGRLYDVPVRLGWLTEPRGESNLNPVPLFL